jgi:hypothetical protein
MGILTHCNACGGKGLPDDGGECATMGSLISGGEEREGVLTHPPTGCTTTLVFNTLFCLVNSLISSVACVQARFSVPLPWWW